MFRLTGTVGVWLTPSPEADVLETYYDNVEVVELLKAGEW